MKERRKDPLRRVLILPASQIGLEDEQYSDQYTGSEEKFSHGPVDNDEGLRELLQISRTLTQIAESLARIEEICVKIATGQSSSENIQTEYPLIWGQKQDKARQLLMDLLTENPEGVDVKRIRTEATMKGISMQTMRRVKQDMGLESEKHDTSWLWKWPDRQ